MKDEIPQGMSRRKWHNPLRMVTTVSAVFAVAVMVIGGFWTYFQYQSPGAQETGPARVVIERGESVTAIGQQLQQAGLIKNASVFRWYIRLSHASGPVQAGMYDIPRGARLPDIVSKFRQGEVVPNTVKVTVPEGYTVADIAVRLETHHICSKQAFLTAEQQGTFAESFVSLLPRNKDIQYRFEGYLFPDTYEFVKGESAHEVINTMLQDFQHHIDAVNVMTALEKQGETLPTLITEASLIEKEALAESDGPRIASVIHNRLKKKMKLQMDATIQYILGHRDIVTDQDLKVKDPYNTYLHYGLPPGPIASPGMTAIMAALHPAKTTYLYYVAKYDGSGTSYFSRTQAQHLRNVKQSEANFKRHFGQ